MKLTEIMTGDVEIIHPDDTLAARDIGYPPVHDGDQLTGRLSDRDIIVHTIAEGMDSKAVAGRELVTLNGESIVLRIKIQTKLLDSCTITRFGGW